jgi:hypothetical protein
MRLDSEEAELFKLPLGALGVNDHTYAITKLITYRPFFMGYRSGASRMLHVVATRAMGTRLAIRTDGSPLAIVRYVVANSLKESDLGSCSSKKG